MSIFLLLIFILIIFTIVLVPLINSQKRKQIEKNLVLEVNYTDHHYPYLPLGKLGIFKNFNQYKTKVQIIFPKLLPKGEFQYIYSWHNLNSVRIPKPNHNKNNNHINLKLAQEIAWIVREHLNTELEINRLQTQWNKLHNLLELVANSEFYENQKQLYQRALSQIENLMDKAEELQNTYVRFIKELLISQQITSYEINSLSSNQNSITTQHQKIQEEYQRMKDTATAYTELLRNKKI